MKRAEILVAHPHKHHVYYLAVGCQLSGLDTQLLVPMYRKGLGAGVAALPGDIGSKARGYHYDKLKDRNVVSPLRWQAKRLLTRAAKLRAFEASFDSYVARRLRRGELRPQILVTMQDYMPATVAAAKKIGCVIWSDQISNQSTAAHARIDAHMREGGNNTGIHHSEARNNAVLAVADVVTVPSTYTADGLFGRLPGNTVIHHVPYGVDERKFSEKPADRREGFRIIARANSVRKGGRLLIQALERYGQRLLELSKGEPIEVIILGSLDEAVQQMLFAVSLPQGLSVVAKTVPHIEVPRLLAAADLFVMPSLSEGMSLICIEAMQMGLPMIITPYCGIDCFRHLEMGLEVIDTVDSLGQGLLTAFGRRDEWSAWGRSGKEATGHLSWRMYETSIAKIAMEVAAGLAQRKTYNYVP